MAEVAQAFVSLVPSAKGFGRGIENEIGGDVDRAGKRSGTRFGASMRTGVGAVSARIFAPIAAAAGAVAIGGMFADFISEARESQKVGALTAQVIKSTGGAARVTAGQVGDLATAISNKTGIDDEAIQSGANLLLTFTNVRNEVGKGNDIFNRATQTITDMSAALGQDTKSSAIQLGKALNDPVKGVTALQRVGVSFTQKQKDQIKTLVDSGKTLEAQKIILGELNKEFGGAAAASANAGDKFAVTFGNFKEAIGTALLPILDKALGALTPFIAGLSTKVGPAFAAVSAGIAQLGNTAPVQALGGVFREAGLGVKALSAAFQEGDVTSNGFIGAMETIGVFLKTQVVPGIMAIATAVRGLVSTVIPIVQQFVAGMQARIEPLMPRIRAIFATIGQIITAALSLIQAVVQRVTTVIAFIWSHWGESIMTFLAKIFGNIITIVGGALKIILGIIRLVTSLIRGDWSGAWDAIKGIVSAAWSVIKGIVSLALNVLKGILSAAWAVIKSAALAVWDRLVAGVKEKINTLVANVRGLRQRILDGLGNLRSMLLQAGRDLIQGLIDGISAKIQAVRDKIGEVAQAIKDFFPGSPVKEGPLVAWNKGRTGQRLGGLLAEGLDASRSTVAAASSRLASSVQGPGALGAGMGSAGNSTSFVHNGDIRANDPLDYWRQVELMQRQQALGAFA